ncbi:uncharacterized protein LOC127103549 [Lathyrus oleraceus]|uniref:uncharacterized protein LOC127103549 n=1 Tax=Pisum sativum TaxID=3888 RepID=UPI0021D2D40F|nr:uncharacterized protein LOC127103549 [Pisum sativum]
MINIFLVLIKKIKEAENIDLYIPIVLANFKFKIIPKVLTDRLAQILPHIISKEQKGFVKDMSIKDSKISVSINGKFHGFFNCHRGVRQGDPLSSLLFCIVEDVLSKGLSQMVSNDKIKLMKAYIVLVPSHALYADDIMLFTKGSVSSLDVISALFKRYVECSGHVCNPAKSIMFAGHMSHSRHSMLANKIGFIVGQLAFTYFGVPIFKGRPKVSNFLPIIDKVRCKLAAWKTILLSIIGRIQLVKSVSHSMLMYSIRIYSWPVSLIHLVEKLYMNFIWSADIERRKMVTVSWKICCKDSKSEVWV